MATIFSIEGLPGSGKSTLLQSLRENLPYLGSFRKVVYLSEPVVEWESLRDGKKTGLLELFYRDQKRNAFSFQLLVCITRLVQLEKAIKETPGAFIITERSAYADRHVFLEMLYQEGKIRKIDYQIYLKFFDYIAARVNLEGIIYLDVDPVVCMGRICKRGREGEDLPLDYLTKCSQAYEIWLKGQSGVLRLTNAHLNSEPLLTKIKTYILSCKTYRRWEAAHLERLENSISYPFC